MLSIHHKVFIRDVIEHNLQDIYKFAEFSDEGFVFGRLAVHEEVGFSDAETDFVEREHDEIKEIDFRIHVQIIVKYQFLAVEREKFALVMV